jgi:hypothetical protein
MSTVKELAEPKKGTSTLVRPRFSPGLLLQDSDLNSAVDYGRSLLQLMLRNLFGCGVICGYGVTVTVDNCNILQVTVDGGLALDCLGNPIELTTAQTLKVSCKCAPDLPCEIWVAIRRRECNSSPREVSCTAEDNTSTTVCTRVCDGYEIRLFTELPECICGCPPKQTGPKPTGCCTDASTERAPEEVERLKRLRLRLKKWEECNEEERKQRISDMHAGARCCDEDHRHGICHCSCCCDWVLLAELVCCEEKGEQRSYLVDQSVRRFIRPVAAYDYMAYGVKD